jgi:ATP-dependent protease Clp ATPase subunit
MSEEEKSVTPKDQCSFCGRSKEHFRKIIVSTTGVSICNDCIVAVTEEMIRVRPDEQGTPHLAQYQALKEENADLREKMAQLKKYAAIVAEMSRYT